jgi:hypothetical protein
MQIQGDQISSTIYRELWRRNFAQVQIANAGADPDKSGSLDEQIVIEPSFDGSNALCVDTFNNTLATLL